MIQAPAPQLQKAALLLVMTLCVVFIYTFLHESGHALVGVLSGAEITTFSLGLWDLNPHVSLTGALTPTQRIVNNVAGVGLPLLVWLVWMLATPRRANLALQAVKLLSALVVLNTLLAWIVIPVLFWAGRAPSDDVTQFLTNSGVTRWR